MNFTVKKLIPTLLACTLFSVTTTVSAATYQYDDLNRVTAVEKENRTINYTYDQGGNLLSVTSTTRPSVQKSNIIEGWTAYMTKGMKAHYETATANVYGDSPVTYYRSVTDSVYEDSGTSVVSSVYETTDHHLNTQTITLNGKRTGGANIYRDIPVQGGTSYMYEGWVQTDNTKDAVVQVIINYYDNKKRLIQYDNVLNLKQNTAWKNYSANLTAPANAVQARVHLQIVLLKANGHATASFADRTFEQVKGSQR